MLLSNPFASRPAFEVVDEGIFGFGDSANLENLALSHLADYARALHPQHRHDGSLWDPTPAHEPPIEVLRRDLPHETDHLVADLFASPLTHGFAQGHIVAAGLRSNQGSRLHVGTIALDRLYRLAEAVGVSRVRSLEHGQFTIEVGDLESLLRQIEEAVGVALPSPRQAGGLFGLRIRGSIYCERHFDAIYGAWRARQLVTDLGATYPTLLEIGGGAGFLAFYAQKFGFRKIAIIDLPYTALVQYIVLAGEFGAQQVQFGAAPEIGFGLIAASSEAAKDFSGWDVVVNVDSLPEMPPIAARNYLESVGSGQVLLSINQESAVMNGTDRQNVVADLAIVSGLARRQRFASWLRSGYVEEVFARK
jgi:hypothetical protein